MPDPKAPHTNFSDPMQVQARIITLESYMREFTNNQNLVQQEIRELTSLVREQSRVMGDYKNHSLGIDRAFKAIEALTEVVNDMAGENRSWRVEKARDEQSWRDHKLEEEKQWRDLKTAEENSWRKEHVAENQKTRDKVMHMSSLSMGLSILFGALVGLVIYNYQNDKTNTSNDIDLIRKNSEASYDLLRNTETRHYELLDQRLDHAEQVQLIMCNRTSTDCKPFR